MKVILERDNVEEEDKYMKNPNAKKTRKSLRFSNYSCAITKYELNV